MTARALPLAATPDPLATPAPSVRLILGVVGDHFGLTRAELRSPQRAPRIVRARWLAMWLARRLTAKSLPAIGRACGGFDHTTVLHAVASVDELARVDATLAGELRVLEAECLAYARSHVVFGLRMDGDVDAEQVARRVLASSRAATGVSVHEVEALAEAVVQAAAGADAAAPAECVAPPNAARAARRAEQRALARLARARARFVALADRVLAFETATQALRGKTGEDAILARQAQADALRALTQTRAAVVQAEDAEDHQEDDHGEA